MLVVERWAAERRPLAQLDVPLPALLSRRWLPADPPPKNSAIGDEDQKLDPKGEGQGRQQIGGGRILSTGQALEEQVEDRRPGRQVNNRNRRVKWKNILRESSEDTNEGIPGDDQSIEDKEEKGGCTTHGRDRIVRVCLRRDELTLHYILRPVQQPTSSLSESRHDEVGGFKTIPTPTSSRSPRSSSGASSNGNRFYRLRERTLLLRRLRLPFTQRFASLKLLPTHNSLDRAEDDRDLRRQKPCQKSFLCAISVTVDMKCIAWRICIRHDVEHKAQGEAHDFPVIACVKELEIDLLSYPLIKEKYLRREHFSARDGEIEIGGHECAETTMRPCQLTCAGFAAQWTVTPDGLFVAVNLFSNILLCLSFSLNHEERQECNNDSRNLEGQPSHEAAEDPFFFGILDSLTAGKEPSPITSSLSAHEQSAYDAHKHVAASELMADLMVCECMAVRDSHPLHGASSSSVSRGTPALPLAEGHATSAGASAEVKGGAPEKPGIAGRRLGLRRLKPSSILVCGAFEAAPQQQMEEGEGEGGEHAIRPLLSLSLTRSFLLGLDYFDEDAPVDDGDGEGEGARIRFAQLRRSPTPDVAASTPDTHGDLVSYTVSTNFAQDLVTFYLLYNCPKRNTSFVKQITLSFVSRWRLLATRVWQALPPDARRLYLLPGAPSSATGIDNPLEFTPAPPPLPASSTSSDVEPFSSPSSLIDDALGEAESELTPAGDVILVVSPSTLNVIFTDAAEKNLAVVLIGPRLQADLEFSTRSAALIQACMRQLVGQSVSWVAASFGRGCEEPAAIALYSVDEDVELTGHVRHVSGLTFELQCCIPQPSSKSSTSEGWRGSSSSNNSRLLLALSWEIVDTIPEGNVGGPRRLKVLVRPASSDAVDDASLEFEELSRLDQGSPLLPPNAESGSRTQLNHGDKLERFEILEIGARCVLNGDSSTRDCEEAEMDDWRICDVALPPGEGTGLDNEPASALQVRSDPEEKESRKLLLVETKGKRVRLKEKDLSGSLVWKESAVFECQGVNCCWIFENESLVLLSCDDLDAVMAAKTMLLQTDGLPAPFDGLLEAPEVEDADDLLEKDNFTLAAALLSHTVTPPLLADTQSAATPVDSSTFSDSHRRRVLLQVTPNGINALIVVKHAQGAVRLELLEAMPFVSAESGDMLIAVRAAVHTLRRGHSRDASLAVLEIEFDNGHHALYKLDMSKSQPVLETLQQAASLSYCVLGLLWSSSEMQPGGKDRHGSVLVLLRVLNQVGDQAASIPTPIESLQALSIVALDKLSDTEFNDSSQLCADEEATFLLSLSSNSASEKTPAALRLVDLPGRQQPLSHLIPEASSRSSETYAHDWTARAFPLDPTLYLVTFFAPNARMAIYLLSVDGGRRQWRFIDLVENPDTPSPSTPRNAGAADHQSPRPCNKEIALCDGFTLLNASALPVLTAEDLKLLETGMSMGGRVGNEMQYDRLIWFELESRAYSIVLEGGKGGQLSCLRLSVQRDEETNKMNENEKDVGGTSSGRSRASNRLAIGYLEASDHEPLVVQFPRPGLLSLLHTHSFFADLPSPAPPPRDAMNNDNEKLSLPSARTAQADEVDSDGGLGEGLGARTFVDYSDGWLVENGCLTTTKTIHVLDKDDRLSRFVTFYDGARGSVGPLYVGLVITSERRVSLDQLLPEPFGTTEAWLGLWKDSAAALRPAISVGEQGQQGGQGGPNAVEEGPVEGAMRPDSSLGEGAANVSMPNPEGMLGSEGVPEELPEDLPERLSEELPGRRNGAGHPLTEDGGSDHRAEAPAANSAGNSAINYAANSACSVGSSLSISCDRLTIIGTEMPSTLSLDFALGERVTSLLVAYTAGLTAVIVGTSLSNELQCRPSRGRLLSFTLSLSTLTSNVLSSPVHASVTEGAVKSLGLFDPRGSAVEPETSGRTHMYYGVKNRLYIQEVSLVPQAHHAHMHTHPHTHAQTHNNTDEHGLHGGTGSRRGSDCVSGRSVRLAGGTFTECQPNIVHISQFKSFFVVTCRNALQMYHLILSCQKATTAFVPLTFQPISTLPPRPLYCPDFTCTSPIRAENDLLLLTLHGRAFFSWFDLYIQPGNSTPNPSTPLSSSVTRVRALGTAKILSRENVLARTEAMPGGGGCAFFGGPQARPSLKMLPWSESSVAVVDCASGAIFIVRYVEAEQISLQLNQTLKNMPSQKTSQLHYLERRMKAQRSLPLVYLARPTPMPCSL